jgi:hypothetical protein
VTNINIPSLQGGNSIYVIIVVLFALFALNRLALLAFRGIFSVFKIIFTGIKFCFRCIFIIMSQALFCFECIVIIMLQGLYIILDTIDYATELPLSLIFKLTGLVKKMIKKILKQHNRVEVFCDSFGGFYTIEMICDLFSGFCIGYNLSYTVLYLETFPTVASAMKHMEHAARLVHLLQLPDADTHWIMTSHGIVCLVFVVKVVNLFIPPYVKFYGSLLVALKHLKKQFTYLNLPAQDIHRSESEFEAAQLQEFALKLSRKLSVYIGFIVSTGTVSFGQGSCVMVAAAAVCYILPAGAVCYMWRNELAGDHRQ